VKPHLKVDTREMNAALAEYAAHSKRDLNEILNQKAYSILIKAAAMNRVADKGKIQAELGQQASAIRGQKVRFLKGGGIKQGKLIVERIYSPALYAIVRWKAAKEGRTITGAQLEAAARKELSRRMSAVSFMKSGWFSALQKIASRIGKPLKKGNTRKATRGFGDSIPARWFGYNTSVSFWNTSFDKPKNTTDPKPTRWAEMALVQAMNEEMATMKARIAAKLEARARRQQSRLASSPVGSS
jgi:hypothetical protein